MRTENSDSKPSTAGQLCGVMTLGQRTPVDIQQPYSSSSSSYVRNSWVDDTHWSLLTSHLREGHSEQQTAATLQMTFGDEKAKGENPERKPID